MSRARAYKILIKLGPFHIGKIQTEFKHDTLGAAQNYIP